MFWKGRKMCNKQKRWCLKCFFQLWLEWHHPFISVYHIKENEFQTDEAAHPHFLCCQMCFRGKWQLASPSFVCLCHRETAASRRFSGSESHNSAFGVCNCVTSSIASKLTQPALSTLTGGPTLRKALWLCPGEFALVLCPTVGSHSRSFALCLHLLRWVHTRGEEACLKCMQTSLPVNQRRLDLSSARTHTHTRSPLHPV